MGLHGQITRILAGEYKGHNGRYLKPTRKQRQRLRAAFKAYAPAWRTYIRLQPMRGIRYTPEAWAAYRAMKAAKLALLYAVKMTPGTRQNRTMVAWRNSRHAVPVARLCAACGSSFTPARADAKTCSVRCRVALHRRMTSTSNTAPTPNA